MVGAMEAVRNKELTIYSAAAKFKGHVRHGSEGE